MPDNYYPPDEPTQIPPTRPSSGQQGKLVLGGFQDQPQQHSPRQPYQYQSGNDPQRGTHAPQTPPTQYPQRGARAPQTPPTQAQNPQYPQRGAPRLHAQSNPQDAYAPSAYPQGPGSRSTPPQPGQRIPNPRPPRRRKRNVRQIGCLATLAIVIILAIFAFTTTQKVLAFGSAISNQSPLSTQTGYMGGSDRTNLLIMGYGGSGHDGGNLTDSMVVTSIIPSSRHTSLVSVPRDLWVQNPANSGIYTKINVVYQTGSNNGQNPIAGGAAAAQKVSTITGLDVKYWMTIDFTGFRDLINSIGGVDVYVPDSFSSQYPKNDDPNVDASWINIHFDKGNQHMDGERAIEYARARHSTDNPAEGTDFARSARQQLIIKAVLSKVKQVSTWPSLFNAMDALKHTIYTNLSLADLGEFATKMDLNTQQGRIGLSNANVLQDDYSSDGQAILTAKNGDWNGIKTYVQQICTTNPHNNPQGGTTRSCLVPPRHDTTTFLPRSRSKCALLPRHPTYLYLPSAIHAILKKRINPYPYFYELPPGIHNKEDDDARTATQHATPDR